MKCINSNCMYNTLSITGYELKTSVNLYITLFFNVLTKNIIYFKYNYIFLPLNIFSLFLLKKFTALFMLMLNIRYKGNLIFPRIFLIRHN